MMTSFRLSIVYQRIFFGVLSSSLFIFSAVMFFNFISAPTDENIFRDFPSNIIVVKSFSGQFIEKKPLFGSYPEVVPTTFDSIITGDILMAINNGTTKTIKDVNEILSNSPEETIIKVFRPSLNHSLTFKVRTTKISRNIFEQIPNFVVVVDVPSNGASDRAGMKIGDLIIRINGKEFTTAREADRILRLGTIGKSLEYDILRNSQKLVLHVVLAKFGIQITLAIAFLSGIFCMIIGAFIVLSRPNIFAARLIGVGFLFLGFVLATSFSGRVIDDKLFLIIRGTLLITTFALSPALIFHSSHYFPVERPELISRTWIARGYYIASAMVCAIFVYSFVFSIDNNFFALAPFLYMLYIPLRYRNSRSPEYKKLNSVIRWTTLIVLTSILATTLVSLLSPAFSIFRIGILGVLLLAIPLAFLYTIGRYRLLGVNIRVRRNIQYTVLTIVWSVLMFYGLIWVFFKLPELNLPHASIIFTGTSIEISSAATSSPQQIFSEQLMLMALAICLTFGFLIIRKNGQKLIDKKYYRQQYDYRHATQELGELLSTTLSMEELARSFVKKLSELMRLKRAGVLFLLNEESCKCEAAHGFDGIYWKQFCITHESLLIKSIKEFTMDNVVRVDFLPTPLKETFRAEAFFYLVPIQSKNKLIGVMMVGEKFSESVFLQEDFAFLSSAAKQASVAIENSFLYEELSERDRMKHELDVARRIQIDSLPKNIPHIRELDIAGTSIPAMEVGGDFYDYLYNGNDKLTIVIGDVSGKGTSAALYMSKIQGILRSLHGFDLSPKELFLRANKLLYQDLQKRSFVTVLGAEFDTTSNTVNVSRAGHLPLFHFIKVRQNVDKIVPKGLGIGLNDKNVYISELEQKEVPYSSGDIFLFATDGITEAHNLTSDFGDEYLQELLIQHHTTSAKKIQETILQELDRFVGSNPQHDDQTIVVVKVV